MILGPFSLDRMARAVERVRERLLRATGALEQAKIPYAVAGENGVAAWVSRIDESAVRNTQGVDLLICRADLERVKEVLGSANFFYRHSAGMDIFLDGPKAKAPDAVHLIFAGEKVKAEEAVANPEVTESESAGPYKILNLPALVQIKLTAFRDKDRIHLRDLLDVGLIDGSRVGRYPRPLASRLQHLLDTPGG
jgi:hypothetical protein